MVLEAPACLGAAPRPQILSGHPLISIAGAYNVAVPRCWLRRLILLSTATLTLYAQAEVEDYIRSEMELNGIPGLSLAVIDDGELAWAKAYGVQSVASGQPLAVDSPMELASVSKSLTALAVLRLEREGLLQRDQSIATYLPDLLVGDPRWRDVTARHLLQHRSGLRRADDFRVPCCGQPGEFDLQVAVSRIARARLESRPGEIFSYSNANYILAAALVERLGGRPFPDFMEKQVFAELGMTNTTVDRPRAKAWGLADPHEWQWGRVRVSPSVFFGWFGASLGKSTVPDMSRYLALLLSPPQTGAPFLPPDWWEELERGYDLGWYVQTEAHWLNGEFALEHSGDIWGGNTAAILVPRTRSAVVVLTNLGTNRANRIARAVMRRVAGLDLPEPRRTAGSESPDNWAMGFLAAAVLLLAGQTAYARRFRRQRQAGRRVWSPTPLRILRGAVLSILAGLLLYALIGGTPPVSALPTTVKFAVPLLVAVTVSLLLLAAWIGLQPSRKKPEALSPLFSPPAGRSTR